MIEKYVKIIDDLELRFKMAAKVKSYGVAVDVSTVASQLFPKALLVFSRL